MAKISMPVGHLQRVRFLYKSILRLHRGLPAEAQYLGNNYVRDEFKRHKECNQAEASIFLTEWSNYAITIAKQLGLRGPKTGSKNIGKEIDPELLDKMREDQILQLYELMVASKPENTKES